MNTYETKEIKIVGCLAGWYMKNKIAYADKVVQNFKNGEPMSEPFNSVEFMTFEEIGQLAGGN